MFKASIKQEACIDFTTKSVKWCFPLQFRPKSSGQLCWAIRGRLTQLIVILAPFPLLYPFVSGSSRATHLFTPDYPWFSLNVLIQKIAKLATFNMPLISTLLLLLQYNFPCPCFSWIDTYSALLSESFWKHTLAMRLPC